VASIPFESLAVIVEALFSDNVQCAQSTTHLAVGCTLQ